MSNVFDVSYMFVGAERFNQDISNLDVSNITDIRNMFQNAESFNQPTENWDITVIRFFFDKPKLFNPAYKPIPVIKTEL